jgi:hypothetical protein
VLVNIAIDGYDGLVIDRTQIVSAVGQIQVANSYDTYFTSDSVALRATWRLASAVVRPERIRRSSSPPASAAGRNHKRGPYAGIRLVGGSAAARPHARDQGRPGAPQSRDRLPPRGSECS